MSCRIPMFNTQALANNMYQQYIQQNNNLPVMQNNGIQMGMYYNYQTNMRSSMPMYFKHSVGGCSSCKGFKKL